MSQYVLGLFILFFATISSAAQIASIQVFPGVNKALLQKESVRVEFLAERGDPDFSVYLQAFLLNGNDNNKLTPVEDNEGKIFQIAEPINIEKILNKRIMKLTKISLPVDFENLRLPQGNVQMGFVATLVSNENGPLAEMASPIQRLQVAGRVTSLVPFAEEIEEMKSILSDAKVIQDDGSLRTEEQIINVFPSSDPVQSISLVEWESKVNERSALDPQGLAEVRSDVPQPMETEEQLVYFATNRRMTSIKGKRYKYKFYPEVRAKGVDGLTYGACSINLPTRKQEQSWWSKAKADVLKTYIYQEPDFMKALSNAESKDVFLLIHGYANSFEDVILQAGRMKRDLKFKGNVMAFSWPSAGDVKKYWADQRHADDLDNLAAFDHVLKSVVNRVKSQEGKLYILGHSMGNRFLVHALRKLDLDMRHELSTPTDAKADRTIAMVAFAAPDVDLNIFSSVMPSTAAIANLVTFYYSTKDWALDFSEGIHDLDRAGLHPLFHDEMTTVNTDRLKSWFSLGHSYYSSADRAIFDLYLQTRYGFSGEKRRPPLLPDREGEEKWLFKHWFLTKGAS